jgi:hypothetical protein
MMSWATHHSKSEHYAKLAELAVHNGKYSRSLQLYQRAAEEEALALSCLSSRKTRTRGITAVRVVALWLNSGNLQQAQSIADQWLREESLPPFAVNQLRAMLIGNKVLITASLKEQTKSAALTDSAEIPTWLTTSPPQVTQLTPNSNCSAVGSGDINNSTLVQFMSPPNKIPWWTTMASDALMPVVLSADIGNAIVTFKQGLTVTYRATTGNSYFVFLSGNIVDSGTVYPANGTVIYTSTQSAS